ncbi:MAG: EamA family transporter [Firmicutes bacterium]|nr:EamA family transporter [Bacillota bacterium]
MTAFLFALITLFLWGIGPILGKIGLGPTEPFVALSIRSAVVTIVLLFVGLFTGKLQELAEVSTRSALFIAGEGVSAALLGHLTYYYALKLGEASRVAPIVAAFPVVTVIVAVFLLGEQLTWEKVAGLLFIVAGVLLIKN